MKNASVIANTSVCVRACTCALVRACVPARARARARVCVCVCVCSLFGGGRHLRELEDNLLQGILMPMYNYDAEMRIMIAQLLIIIMHSRE